MIKCVNNVFLEDDRPAVHEKNAGNWVRKILLTQFAPNNKRSKQISYKYKKYTKARLHKNAQARPISPWRHSCLSGCWRLVRPSTAVEGLAEVWSIRPWRLCYSCTLRSTCYLLLGILPLCHSWHSWCTLDPTFLYISCPQHSMRWGNWGVLPSAWIKTLRQGPKGTQYPPPTRPKLMLLAPKVLLEDLGSMITNPTPAIRPPNIWLNELNRPKIDLSRPMTI